MRASHGARQELRDPAGRPPTYTKLVATDRELAEQHRLVMAQVEQLDRLTGAAGRGLPHMHARHLLRHHLHMLRRLLVAHFEAEEEDGYFASLRAERPHLDHRIDTLKAQHAPLLEQLVIADAKLPHARLDVIKEDVRAILQTLRDHEAGERALLQDAVLLDIGVGD